MTCPFCRKEMLNMTTWALEHHICLNCGATYTNDGVKSETVMGRMINRFTGRKRRKYNIARQTA